MKHALKYSIRFRFTMIFIGLMAAMLLVIWVINNWFLETFYVNQKVKMLEQGYVRIDAIASANLVEGSSVVALLEAEMEQQRQSDENMDWGPGGTAGRKSLPQGEQGPGVPDGAWPGAGGGTSQPTLLMAIREFGDKNNVGMVMIDSDTGKAVFSTTREGDWLALKVQRYTLGHNIGTTEILSQRENNTIEKSYDPRSGSYFLESWGFFSDDRTLYIMSMPLASIVDSVDLANRFLGYVGLAVMVIGCGLMYVATSRVTLPIMRLAALSEEMSNLNFDAKYEGAAEDEIGVLGHSMNTLSDTLRQTIGALKTANNELQRDIEEKIQVDEMRKEFIANVSHELKTPIALIQGYAEGLVEGMGEDAESRSYYCEVIMDEANRMNTMVRQLLNLSALEFGKDAVSMERFDMVEVVRQIKASADILIQQKAARVLLELPDHCFVWADEFKVEEALTNYLSNALNHLDGERRIRIRVECLDGEAKVSVFNTGAQILEDELPKLWTKFYKVDKAHTRAYGGSGIGLSIVRAIMEAHHKGYGVENVADGVEFWFMVDMAEG